MTVVPFPSPVSVVHAFGFGAEVRAAGPQVVAAFTARLRQSLASGRTLNDAEQDLEILATNWGFDGATVDVDAGHLVVAVYSDGIPPD
jgi:hypothetical protein